MIDPETTRVIYRQADCKRASIADRIKRYHVTNERGLSDTHKSSHPGVFLLSESAGIDYDTCDIVPIIRGQEAYTKAMANRKNDTLPGPMSLFPKHHPDADEFLDKFLRQGNRFQQLQHQGLLALGHVSVYISNTSPVVIDFCVPRQLIRLATEIAEPNKGDILANNIAIASLRRAFKFA